MWFNSEALATPLVLCTPSHASLHFAIFCACASTTLLVLHSLCMWEEDCFSFKLKIVSLSSLHLSSKLFSRSTSSSKHSRPPCLADRGDLCAQRVPALRPLPTLPALPVHLCRTRRLRRKLLCSPVPLTTCGTGARRLASTALGARRTWWRGCSTNLPVH